MKNKATLHDELELNNSIVRGNGTVVPQHFKLGLDVELRKVAVAIQCGQGVLTLLAENVESNPAYRVVRSNSHL